MATKEISAVMALRVYDQDVDIDNLPRFPYEGWVKEPNTLSVTNGFAYGVFRNTTTNEVVIAYRGTDGASGMMGHDGVANIQLFLGVPTSQLIQAAQVYTEVLRLYGSDANGSNISFTGHSLGGGLAGIMAVYFNRPAIVFDPAPFQLSALSAVAVHDVVQALGSTAPAALLAYEADRITSFAARELAVASHYVVGEFLEELGRSSANTIYGTNTPYEFGNQAGEVSAFTMHSQALLVTGLLSDSFRQATVTVQAALPVIMSGDYYSQEPAGSDQKNFLIDLIRSEQANIGNGKLSHFAADLHRLGQDLTGLNETA